MHNNLNATTEQPLKPIVGQPLSAVVFVQDYVQLQFDGRGLTVLTWPVVKIGSLALRYGMTGYRDMLCERITKTVRAASITVGEEIYIEFDDDSIITISLRPEDYCAAEAVIFYNGPNETWVW